MELISNIDKPEPKKKINRNCEHGRRKNYCRECGGSGICEHNNNKAICKLCGGSQLCQHNRIKSCCKECKGGSICEHNKRRVSCRLCNGSVFCIHGKIKYICKLCGGSQICSHGHVRSHCIQCKGGHICEHNHVRSRCVECGTSTICQHKKLKWICVECHGTQVCVHNKLKYACVECYGMTSCKHNIPRLQCDICRMQITFCKHSKIRKRCKECGGEDLCKSSWCETRGNKKYDGYCLPCFVNLFPDKPNTRNYKTKERAVVEYVFQQFPQELYSWVADKKIEDGCSKKRPDLLLDLGYQVIIVEVDEYQHDVYECSCENKRIMQLSQDVGHRPIIFIRFNPDEYIDYNNKKITSCWGINGTGICTLKKTKIKEWNDRLQVLRDCIDYWCQEENKTDKTVEIIQLFYNSL